jgi:hypothetical protein
MCIAAIGPLLGMMVGMAQAGVQAAAAQEDYSNRAAQWKQNVTNAWAAARDEQKQLLLRHMQEENAVSQKTKLSQIEEAQKRSLVEVSAAYAGVSGLSIENLTADVTRRAAMNRETERTNFLYTAQQIQAEQKATITRAEQRIASVPYPTPPNTAAPFISALASGIKGFAG